MSKINLVGRKSITSKLLNAVYIGVTGTILFGGYKLIAEVSKNTHLSSNASRVESLINAEDYSGAEELLESLSDSNSIRHEDVNRLFGTLNFHETRIKMESLIHSGDVVGAKKILSKVKGSDESLFDVSNLELLLNSYSEEALVSKLASGDYDFKLLKLFLKLYPESNDAQSVAKSLVYKKFGELSNSLESQLSIDGSYVVLSEMTHLCKDLKEMDIDFSSISKFVLNEKSLSEQLSYEYLPFKQGRTHVGSVVKVGGFVADGWNSGYVPQRSFNIPDGSVGKIQAMNDYGLIVEFEDIEGTYWKTSWGYCDDFWSDLHRNVACYKSNELLERIPVDPIKKSKFMSKVSELKKILNVQE